MITVVNVEYDDRRQWNEERQYISSSWYDLQTAELCLLDGVDSLDGFSHYVSLLLVILY